MHSVRHTSVPREGSERDGEGTILVKVVIVVVTTALVATTLRWMREGTIFRLAICRILLLDELYYNKHTG
jgi:hypothetical protein